MKQTRYKANLHVLLLDDSFWLPYYYSTLNIQRAKRLREYRIKFFIPSKKSLIDWIEKDYKRITNDTRSNEEIITWLTSPAK